MQTVASDLLVVQCRLIGSIKQKLVFHENLPFVGDLKKIETAKQGGFPASRRADDGQHLALGERKINSLQHFKLAKALFKSLYG